MISVIVPAKNASPSIGECLEALLHQEGLQLNSDYELILVDDGSTDNTAALAEKYAVKVIRQQNKGPGAARNAGAAVAQGSILAFTDADCAPTPSWLANIVSSFINPAVVGVKGAYLTRQSELVARFVQLEYEYKYARMARQSNIDFIDTYSAAYRKDVFVQNGGFNAFYRVLEDQELSSRLARKGYLMVFDPRATVYHYHNRNLMEYMRKKYRIGYWKAFMLHSVPEKTLTDSHTAPTQRVEILMLAFLIASIPVLFFLPLLGSMLFLAFLVSFLVSITPFLKFIRQCDPPVFWIAPLMLMSRAGALGLGLARGFIYPPRAQVTGYPCQFIGVRMIKRLVDILGGCIGCALSAPVILLSAIAIRLDTAGPVIFKQPRAGEFGKHFTIFKLRTMVDGAEKMVSDVRALSPLKGPAFKIPNDPRITRVGRYLRRWSLDELPQFWNVLKGDMSLVGPRPEVLHLVEQYTDSQRQRLMVKPGLTGPVQVNGGSGLDFDQRFQLEMEYLKNYTLLEDIRILFKTIPAIISGAGIA